MIGDARIKDPPVCVFVVRRRCDESSRADE
jgi:hypothetical protein